MTRKADFIVDRFIESIKDEMVVSGLEVSKGSDPLRSYIQISYPDGGKYRYYLSQNEIDSWFGYYKHAGERSVHKLKEMTSGSKKVYKFVDGSWVRV